MLLITAGSSPLVVCLLLPLHPCRPWLLGPSSPTQYNIVPSGIDLVVMFSNSFLPTQCVSSSMWRHWYYQITVITRTAKNISHHRFHSCCFTRCNQHFRHFTEIDILKVFLSSGNICHQHSHNHYHQYYEPHPQLWLWIIKVWLQSLSYLSRWPSRLVRVLAAQGSSNLELHNICKCLFEVLELS